MREKLTEKQVYALEVITMEPQTAKELGVAAATLTSLVNKGLVQKIGTKSPFKYAKIEIKPIGKGSVEMKTVDGEIFEFNIYSYEKDNGYNIRWNDNNGNPHTGTLLRMREGDEGFYARSREYNGIVFVKFSDICVLVKNDDKGCYVSEIPVPKICK